MNSEDEICGHGRIFCKRENLSLGGYNQVPESAHDRKFFSRDTLRKTIEIKLVFSKIFLKIQNFQNRDEE
jgi:hypothetical protein